MGMNKYTIGTQREFPFANKAFLQNCLDYLINENGLSEAKAKDYTAKLLDNKNGKQILIDVKHMSVSSRQDYYHMLDAEYKTDKIGVLKKCLNFLQT